MIFAKLLENSKEVGRAHLPCYPPEGSIIPLDGKKYVVGGPITILEPEGHSWRLRDRAEIPVAEL